MRFLSGIIRITLCWYWFTGNQDDILYHYLRNNYDEIYSLRTINTLVGGIYLIPNCLSIYHFVKGIYMVYTCNYSTADFLYNAPTDNYNNINSVLKYRNGMMNTMSNEKASQEYLKTSWLDGAMNTSGTNTQNAVKYLNGKLGTMSNENGLKYIKGEGQKK